jgi:hypothetical protein
LHLQHDPENFERFLLPNSRFWRENSGYSSGSGDILVDLAHEIPAYLFTNLVIAKYLQRLSGGRVVGVARSWKAIPRYDIPLLRRFADSFYIDEIVDVDAAIDPQTARKEIDEFHACISNLSGPALRDALLNFQVDSDPDIGWLLYDTYLRGRRVPTVETVDTELLEYAAEVLASREALARCLANRRLKAAVVGHYHYSPYAFIALEALRAGARVYFQSPVLPFTIMEFSSCRELRAGRPATFLKIFRDTLARTDRGRIESFARRVFDVQEGARQFFKSTRNNGTAQDRTAVLAELRLKPEQMTIGVFSPALCAAPHAFGSLVYHDFGQWLNATLEFARTRPEINFIVKPHPQDDVYDLSASIGKLEDLFRNCDNIRFLSRDASPHETCWDAIVTTNGTPGYEMVLRGVPAITTGRSRYSDLGIACEASDEDSYHRLISEARNLQATPESRWRATEFAWFDMVARRCRSILAPSFSQAEWPGFWSEAIRSVQSISVEEDPLYRNFRRMLDHGSPLLINADLVP